MSLAQFRQLQLAVGGGSSAFGARTALAHDSVVGGGALNLTHGVVVPFRIPPTKSHFRARTAEIYLPPAYFQTPRPQLPVIELLHGTPGAVVDWTRGGLADVTSDAYAAQHDGVAPVLVMPDVNGSWDSDTECVNGTRGQAQTYLTDDVRAAVISRLGTRRDPGGWAIAGFSEGGYCALQIGLRHPNLYGAIGDFSGESGPSTGGGVQHLFSGSAQQAEHDAAAYRPANLLAGWNRPVHPVIWFEVGSSDDTLATLARLDVLAHAHGFETRFVEQQLGSHSFASWRQAFRDALPWIASSFGTPSTAMVRGRA
jgi:S-formylglutathione hydrolase FrmB